MKKLVYIASIMLAGMIIVMLSCNKKEESQVNNQENLTENAGKLMFNRMEKFQQKLDYLIKNPTAKSEEKINRDDLLWNLNASINFYDAEPDADYSQTKLDSTFSSVSIDMNDSISLTDAVVLYNDIMSKMNQKLADNSFEHKTVKLNLLEIKEQNNGTMELKSSLTIGDKSSPAGPSYAFTEDHEFGNDEGLCDSPVGVDLWDAADKLGDMINLRRNAVHHINDGGCWFYYNFSTKLINDFITKPEFILYGVGDYDNIRDYRLFYVQDGVDGTLAEDFHCISYQDMNFYRDQLEEIVYNILPNPILNPYWTDLNNKTFVTVEEMDGYDDLTPYPGEQIYFIHTPKVVFAKRWNTCPID